VRAGQIAASVPAAADGVTAGTAAVTELRGPGFLTDPHKLKVALLHEARALGFDAIGATRPDAVPEAKSRLEKFLADGAHGDMAWLEANSDRRGNPRILWPEVRSIIMLGMNYGPDSNPLEILKQRTSGAISVYARSHADYHDIIKQRLKTLARWL